MSAERERVVSELQTRAKALGFDAFGIAAADARPDLGEKLESAIAQGWHGDMDWLAETKVRRADPRVLWPDAKSVILLGINYGPHEDPMDRLKDKGLGNISVYAQSRDYHDVVKGKLKELAGLLARRADAEVKVFVDTAPIMEKPLAEAAGIGWQGKHSVLVSREFGSWLFLGAILTNAELPASAPHAESCGSCTRCLDVCPTDAFPAPFRLDARKCLAYLNNEHKGQIPLQYRKPMGNRVFGCDDCLAVCPWNKFASRARETRLQAKNALAHTRLADLLALDDAAFRTFFAGTPVKRLGSARFLRNCLVAAGNSGDSGLVGLVSGHLEHESPLVRGMAVWAARQLAPEATLAGLRRRHVEIETDSEVMAEWTM
ncbi:tRNA epoxyqueuosine(34) reductase QueG [Pelagibacterium xiamenense]|uniref:tRNA epoxyqueuosine(34) reductase QueG n=1 Tax=Pelagibacterium xiamenense TaxID=2901140 RepID=UPI001E5D7119|nr:tRNA epoxyqueuosine(34) reductase QueG [Pelagibacterium xiamenense]MCD7058547.1 tRNA epoxyqueuosine(34) reductase QueG [Pelagibacterium xiamenense]